MFSVRMHSSKQVVQNQSDAEPVHVSGGERLVSEGDVALSVNSLLARAISHPNGPVDSVTLTVEKIDPSKIERMKSLPIVVVRVETPEQGREFASLCLLKLGISRELIQLSINWMVSGPRLDGGNMRGAVLLDVQKGQRVEPNTARGVRASRVDYTSVAEHLLDEMLHQTGTYGPRTRDALALATKIVSRPGVQAELCCSDDPGYTGGYVASPALGYIRINHLKKRDHPVGGRIIFLDMEQLEVKHYVNYLEKVPVLLDSICSTTPPLSFSEATEWLATKEVKL